MAPVTVSDPPTPVSPKVAAVAAVGAVVSGVTLVAALFGVEIEVTDEAVGGLGLLLTAAVSLAGWLKTDPLRRARR